MHRAARVLDRALAGHVSIVRVHWPALRAWSKRLSGQTVLNVETRGKALLVHFSNEQSLYAHNQLYGEWRVQRPNSAPHASKALRVEIESPRAVARLYSATDIQILATDQVEAHPYVAKLGPDLLASTTTLAIVRAQVDSARFARRALWSLLLDQGFLAGIGNNLRSEILFLARLHPNQKLGALDAAARERLSTTALKVARRSLATGGITNEPARAAALKAAGWSHARYRHWVFDRPGKACHVCTETIARVDVGGRAIFWCAGCQER